MTEQNLELFVTCSSGLEPILLQELTELGFAKVTPGFRGVYVSDTSMRAVYQINYCSRIAGRVLLPISRFRCHTPKTLYQTLSKIDWMQYIPNNKTFAIDANVHHHEFRNSLYAAQVAKDAICDQYRERTGGKRPNIDVANPDVQLNLFIHRDLAIMSFDTSGTPLHKRGYRLESVAAPIQESLAAALLKIAGYKGNEILYDPFCGSGTFLIEAALMATHTAPGFLRQKWGFSYLPSFAQEEWLTVKAQADAKRVPLAKRMLFGTDNNKDAVRISKVNLRAAGFHQSVEVINIDFREYTPQIMPNFLITNPPYGNRMGELDHLRPVYRTIGDWMKHHMAKPARGFVFTGSMDLSKEIGLAPTKRHVIEASGVECRFLEYDIY